MRKFTTIILLSCTFSILSTIISAQNADINLLRSINSNTATIGYSKFISNTTTYVSFGVPVIMGAVALLDKDDDLLKNAIYIGVSIGVGGVLTQVIKYSVNRPRPITLNDPTITAYEGERDLSFPSGHVSLAFSTATALCLKYPKWYVIVPSSLWACSVGYSRMNLGVHYPSDVVAGAILGAGSAWVTYKINDWFWKKEGNKKLISLQSYL
jgi:membrane-associated phospholipid phosphatase